MRGQNLGGGDDGHPGERRAVLCLRGDPARRRAIDRLADVTPLRQGLRVVRDQREHAVRVQHAARHLDAMHENDIDTGPQRRGVGEPDLGQDEPVAGRHMATHIGDANVEPGARVEHHIHEVRRELDVDLIYIQHIPDRICARPVRRRPPAAARRLWLRRRVAGAARWPRG